MAYFSKDFVEFFKELAANNHKEWFDENRKRYEKEVKDPFKHFIEDMILRIQKDDPKVKPDAKDAIFRINRDIRFSKDKTPYKIQMSAVISRGGRKDFAEPGTYIELTPEHVRVYSGIYGPDKHQLYNVRSYLATHLKEFEKVFGEEKFVKMFGSIRGEQNKIIAPEFKEVAKKQPLMLNKQFYFFGEMKPEVIAKDELADRIMDYYFAGKAARQFLSKALKG